MSKLLLLGAFGAGYVLGAKAGRERYDQIVSTAAKVRNDPRVQDAAHKTTDAAKQQAPVVKDKVAQAAAAAADKAKDVAPGGSGSDSGS